MSNFLELSSTTHRLINDKTELTTELDALRAKVNQQDCRIRDLRAEIKKLQKEQEQ